MCTGWPMKLMIELECLDRYTAYAVCLDIWDSTFGLFGTNQTFKNYKDGKRKQFEKDVLFHYYWTRKMNLACKLYKTFIMKKNIYMFGSRIKSGQRKLRI